MAWPVACIRGEGWRAVSWVHRGYESAPRWGEERFKWRRESRVDVA